jgi:hypothetical protein
MAELEGSVAACRVSSAALRYRFWLETGRKDGEESCVVVVDGVNGTTQVL